MKKHPAITKVLPAVSLLAVMSFLTYEFSTSNTLFINFAFVLLIAAIGFGLTMIASTEAENQEEAAEANDPNIAHQTLAP